MKCPIIYVGNLKKYMAGETKMHDCNHVTYSDHTTIMTISITIRMVMTTTTIMITTMQEYLRFLWYWQTWS